MRQLLRRRTSASLAHDEGLADSHTGTRPGYGGRARLSLSRVRSGRNSQAELAGQASAAVAEVEHPPTARDPAAAAFFDVDNTLMRGASMYHLARGLAVRKMFAPKDFARMALRQASFRVRGAETSGNISAVRQLALTFVAGQKVAELVQLGEEIFDDTMAARIWQGTREIVQRHLEAGQRVWLVTATPVELANILSRRLGLTGALGTVAETAHGKYTGRLVGELLHGEAKAAAIQALADREGLDLTKCSAYSDSANDLPMLRLVGHPAVVNPDPDLREEARRQGWPIYDFRLGRRATIITLPVLASAIVCGIFIALALRRRWTRT
jgi:HAD superfamily hydrolase (TIGR01490 family)